MGWDTRMKHARACAAFAAAMMLSTALSIVPSQAQDTPAKPTAAKGAAKPGGPASPAAAEAAQKQKETEAAKRAYEAGIKSYQAGKFEPAVQSLSAALRGGGLSSQDMARGLYYRGLAYKKQSKPGLAISDLTSALWLKNGLSDADRQSATAERSDAYKQAGLGDGNSGTETVAVVDPNAKQQAAASPTAASADAASPARTSVSTAASKPAAGSDGIISNPFAVGEGPPQRTIAKVRNSEGSVDQIAALEQQRVVSATAPVAPVAAPAAAASIPAPIPSEGTSGASNNTVSGFFSNLFGGSSDTPAVEQAPVTKPMADQATAATSSWTDTASVASTATAKSARVAKVDPPIATAAITPAPAAPAPVQVAQKAAAPQVKGGKYKLHIAAMRSRPEAEALAQKLAQQYGNQLAARSPTVDEAVIGSMGTFYRVRVGSYATADEPRGLCNKLRNSGYDCLVVTN
jgi:tetratricopeptide (TPR) repeat protein